MATEQDPSAIQSIAVSPSDVVDAFVYSRQNPGEAVLRATPPFHGRMRARLHVYRVDDTELTGAVHLVPADLIDDDVVAAYPTFEETLDGEEPTDRTRQRHTDAVDGWRDRARTALVETVSIETDDGPKRVALKPVGR